MRREKDAVRLLLLVTVVLGLGWMHTLGHRAHETGGPHAMTAAVAHVPGGPTVSAGTSVAPGMPTAPDTQMCLAVLAATVLLAVALLTAHVRRGSAAGTTPGAAHPTERGPPRARPFSLLYADLTVLRI